MTCWNEIIVLVERAKTGDREAFGDLVVRFQGSVFALAMARLRNAGDAEELTQDVFIHAMRKLPQLRDARAFAGWLRQMTARMAINKITRRGPVFGAEQDVLEAVAGKSIDPAADCERGEAKDRLLIALGELKPEDRATLEAFYLKGESLKEMAVGFAAPIGTIKRRLFTARARLKAAMGEEELIGV